MDNLISAMASALQLFTAMLQHHRVSASIWQALFPLRPTGYSQHLTLIAVPASSYMFRASGR